MSRFISGRLSGLQEYIPGEQPRDMQYIKLNTNESPFPPHPAVRAALDSGKAACLQLYSDPQTNDLTQKLAAIYGVGEKNIVVGNGSDEILNFCFAAYFDSSSPVVFPDITYGFYRVFANLYNSDYTEIPLDGSLRVDPGDYIGCGRNIVLANPNAPTGIALSTDVIEKIVVSNPDNIVIIDEAYVDFGAASCAELINKYDNLIVTMTFSKSRSLAGARVGFAIACETLCADLQKIRNSTNPYNINSMSAQAALACLQHDDKNRANCQTIIETREYFCRALSELGFEYLPSLANFVFVKKPGIGGKYLYERLKESGILVRHFDSERIADYLRITVGSREQMDILLKSLKETAEEKL